VKLLWLTAQQYDVHLVRSAVHNTHPVDRLVQQWSEQYDGQPIYLSRRTSIGVKYWAAL